MHKPVRHTDWLDREIAAGKTSPIVTVLQLAEAADTEPLGPMTWGEWQDYRASGTAQPAP